MVDLFTTSSPWNFAILSRLKAKQRYLSLASWKVVPHLIILEIIILLISNVLRGLVYGFLCLPLVYWASISVMVSLHCLARQSKTVGKRISSSGNSFKFGTIFSKDTLTI